MGRKSDEMACFESGKLVYYRRHMDRSFWDDHWHKCDSPQFYEPYLAGYIGRGRLAHVLRHRLPRPGRILEAGCGKAQHVVSLRARGNNCVGIDNAKETIVGVRRLFPTLPLAAGDVRRLPWKGGAFAAYVSLGVVEHFVEGPATALCEAHRVLADDGVLIISVPQVFPWRRRENRKFLLTADFSFYQYAFSHEEFAGLLDKSGFKIDKQYGYGSDFALQLRWPAVGKLFASFPRLAAALRMVLDATPYIWQRCSRMRLYCARKK